MSGETENSGGGVTDFLREVYGDVVDLAIAREQSRTVGSNGGTSSPPPNAPAPAAQSSGGESLGDLFNGMPQWAKLLLVGSVVLLVGASVYKLTR